MDSSHEYNESIRLPCHASLHVSSPFVAPPPSPLHAEEQMLMDNSGNEKMRHGRKPTRGNCESLADELSHSLATIAREERRKVQYARGDASSRNSFGAEARQSSDGGGDASEESWLSFLGTQSAPGPPLVTATTCSSDDRYSSNSGRSSNNDSSDGHGLPKPVDDRVGTSHGDNGHASVIASLPPPLFKSSGGGSSSSVRSSSSCEKSRSGEEERCTNKQAKRETCTLKRAPPPEISKFDGLMMRTLRPKHKKRRMTRIDSGSDDEKSSSSSGSEGGYDASSSDNRFQQSSCSSPSVSSSEAEQERPRRKRFISRKIHAKRSARGRSHSVKSSGSSSSELADFSLSPSRLSDSSSVSLDESDSVKVAQLTRTHHHKKRSHDVASLPRAAVAIPFAVADPIGSSSKMFMATMRRHQKIHSSAPGRGQQHLKKAAAPRHRLKSEEPVKQQAPIFTLGSDMMAQCMTYLEPTEVHSLLTVPLSKQWRDTYTVPQDLWRVLCLMEPFRAKFGPSDLDESSDESVCSMHSDPELKQVFGKYRLLYTSFIRCLRYLTQIKDDALHGREAPSVLDYGGGDQGAYHLTSNSGLRDFLAKARVAVGGNRKRSITAAASAPSTHVELSDDDRSVENEPMVSVSDSWFSFVVLECRRLTFLLPCFLFSARNQRRKLQVLTMVCAMVIPS